MADFFSDILTDVIGDSIQWVIKKLFFKAKRRKRG